MAMASLFLPRVAALRSSRSFQAMLSTAADPAKKIAKKPEGGAGKGGKDAKAKAAPKKAAPAPASILTLADYNELLKHKSRKDDPIREKSARVGSCKCLSLIYSLTCKVWVSSENTAALDDTHFETQGLGKRTSLMATHDNIFNDIFNEVRCLALVSHSSRSHLIRTFRCSLKTLNYIEET